MNSTTTILNDIYTHVEMINSLLKHGNRVDYKQSINSDSNLIVDENGHAITGGTLHECYYFLRGMLYTLDL